MSNEKIEVAISVDVTKAVYKELEKRYAQQLLADAADHVDVDSIAYRAAWIYERLCRTVNPKI